MLYVFRYFTHRESLSTVSRLKASNLLAFSFLLSNKNEEGKSVADFILIDPAVHSE